MTRRLRTLLVGGALFVVLFVLAITLPVPYAILGPGPTYNTLGVDDHGAKIIVLKGKTANQVSGHLNMTTVDVTTDRITAFQALLGWLQHDRSVVPRSAVVPPGQSQQQVNQQDTQQFAESQDSATQAAFCQLGYPRGFGITSVDSSSGANGVLHPGDELVSIDGKPADSADKLTAALQTETPGKSAAVVVKRDGTQMTEMVKLSPATGGAKGARIGISVVDGCLAPFEVDLGLGDEIGGPSSGLMFALGIMQEVGTVDLTKGAFIAGTGEIQPDGTVLPIGGIQLKMIAARDKGATVFLAPAANCSDVRGATPKGLNVIKVSALKDAVQDLLDLQAGKAVSHC